MNAQAHQPPTKKENSLTKKSFAEKDTNLAEKVAPVTAEEEKLFADTNITMKSGHLVKDPVIVGDGKYAKIRIASNKEYQTADGKIKTNTNYFNALVSSNLEEAFEKTTSFKKGDWVYLKGEDSTKSFDTPEGYKQTASTIFAYHVVLKKQAKVNEIDKASNTANSATLDAA